VTFIITATPSFPIRVAIIRTVEIVPIELEQESPPSSDEMNPSEQDLSMDRLEENYKICQEIERFNRFTDESANLYVISRRIPRVSRRVF
jgi:hypothetical protein